MNVKIYTTPTCGYCHQVKRFLAERGVKYMEYDVSRDRAAADGMIHLTGQMAVPVIVVDDQVVIGFDRVRLQRLLYRSNNGQHPRLGLKVADGSKAGAIFGLVSAAGALVGKVGVLSLGEKAGLKEGDIITQVNSRSIGNAEDLENALSAQTSGSRVVIVFLRGEETMKTEIMV